MRHSREAYTTCHSRHAGLQGKFSAEYTVLALLDGYVRLSGFEDAQVQRAEIQSRLPTSTLLKLEETGKTSD